MQFTICAFDEKSLTEHMRISNFPSMDEYQVWLDGVKIGGTHDSLEYAKIIISRGMQHV